MIIHGADEYLSKLQTSLKNKLLKLMLKLDRRTSSNQLHRDLSLLKVSDIHDGNVLCCVIRRPLLLFHWIGLHLFNDDTRPTGHIGRPTLVGEAAYNPMNM